MVSTLLHADRKTVYTANAQANLPTVSSILLEFLWVFFDKVEFLMQTFCSTFDFTEVVILYMYMNSEDVIICLSRISDNSKPLNS